MESFGTKIRNIIVWKHGRGTLQYDIICALILAFIFFVPRSCFVPPKPNGPSPSVQKARTAPQTTAIENDKSKK